MKIHFFQSEPAPSSIAADEIGVYGEDVSGAYHLWCKDSDGNKFDLVLGDGDESSGAPADATFIVQTAHADLPNAQALSSLPTGDMQNTTATGVVTVLKSNRTATTAPTVSDDNTAGYSVGSKWINLTTDTIYECTDASTGAALWREIVSAAGIQTLANKILSQLQLLIGGFKAIFTHANTADRTYSLPDYDATLATLAAGEIEALAEKVTPVAADIIPIEDSEDSYTRKYVQVGNLPGGGTLPAMYRSRGAFQIKKTSNDIFAVGTGQMVVDGTLVTKDTSTEIDVTTAANWIGGSSLRTNNEYIKIYLNDAGVIKISDKMPNRTHAAAPIAEGQINGSPGLDGTSIVYDGITVGAEGDIDPEMMIYFYQDSGRTLGRSRGASATQSVDDLSGAIITAINTGTDTITVESNHWINLTDNDYWTVLQYGPVEYYYDGSGYWRLIDIIYNRTAALDDKLATGVAQIQHTGTDYAITSATFVAVDNTNLQFRLLCSGRMVNILFSGGVAAAGAAVNAYLTLGIDTLDVESYVDGLWLMQAIAITPSFAFHVRLLPGTHYIELRARKAATNWTFYTNAATVAVPATLHAQEYIA